MADTQTPTPTHGETPDAGKQPPTFEAWLETQPEDVRGRFEDHTHSLKTALEAERTGRKAAEKALRDEAKKFDKGSDERKSLEEMAGKLGATQRQADFYDAAHSAGVSNLRLAWLAAQDGGLVGDDGAVDFEKLKAQHPQLFTGNVKLIAPAGNAGAGTGKQPIVPPTMNTLIRRAAGIRA